MHGNIILCHGVCERETDRMTHKSKTTFCVYFFVFPLKTGLYLWCVCVQQVDMATGGAPMPAGPAHCVTKVQLTISCHKLLDMDVFSKSDPLCALYMNTSGGQWYEVSTVLGKLL